MNDICFKEINYIEADIYTNEKNLVSVSQKEIDQIFSLAKNKLALSVRKEYKTF